MRSLLSRLSDAELADLLAPLPPARAGPREPSVILLERCPVCREWLTRGAKALGQCRACGAWVTPVVS